MSPNDQDPIGEDIASIGTWGDPGRVPDPSTLPGFGLGPAPAGRSPRRGVLAGAAAVMLIAVIGTLAAIAVWGTRDEPDDLRVVDEPVGELTCGDVSTFLMAFGNLGITADYQPSASLVDLADRVDRVLRGRLVGLRDVRSGDDAELVFAIDPDDGGTTDLVEFSRSYNPAEVRFAELESAFTSGIPAVVFLHEFERPWGYGIDIEGFFVSCGDDQPPLAVGVSPSWSPGMTLDGLMRPTLPSTTTTAPTTTSTTSPGPVAPSAAVAATAAGLATGWQPVPFDVVARAAPRMSATSDSVQAVVLSFSSGCCFGSTSIWTGPIGGPLRQAADVGVLLPDEGPRTQTLLSSGPAAMISGPSGFVAVGAWTSVQDEKQSTVPYAWTSAVGETWVAHDLAGSGTMTSVVQANGGYLAIIDDSDENVAGLSSGRGTDARLMSSVDGAEWVEERTFAPADAPERRLEIIEIGERLAISGDQVVAVSDDGGSSWDEPTGEIADGTLVAVDGGAGLLIREDGWLWSRDGIGWAPIGRGEATGNGSQLAPGGPWNATVVGEVVVVNDGADLWVSDSESPWVLVAEAPVFAEVPAGDPVITELTIAADGTWIGLGAVPADLESNSPVNDYLMWVHAPIQQG